MHYDYERTNTSAAKLFFMFFQMIMVLIVYGFIYTAMVGVKLAISKYALSSLTYLPEIAAIILYPAVLYRTRKMFNQKKHLRAVAWCMAWASVIIVVLYLHLSKLIPA